MTVHAEIKHKWAKIFFELATGNEATCTMPDDHRSKFEADNPYTCCDMTFFVTGLHDIAKTAIFMH